MHADRLGARRLWHRLELVHAVTYFAPEARQANAAAGLRGFWMGYFAARAAPLGAVSAATVTACFFGFRPSMVARAVPDAWSYADPGALVQQRAEAAAGVLRRLADRDAEAAGAAAQALGAAADAAPPAGRPLFAANRDVQVPDEPFTALWQASTTMREHRGDSHVALLTALSIDGCEAHVLSTAWKGIPPDVVLESRGWSGEEWAGAAERLRRRGWVDEHRRLTAEGRRVRQEIEDRTDELSDMPFVRAGVDIGALTSQLEPIARSVQASGLIPFPNPMGLPRTADEP